MRRPRTIGWPEPARRERIALPASPPIRFRDFFLAAALLLAAGSAVHAADDSPGSRSLLPFAATPESAQGFSPTTIVTTRDGAHLYLGFSLSETLFKLRRSDLAVEAVADLSAHFPANCRQIALDRTETKLFAALPAWKKIVVVDAGTMNVLRTLDGIDATVGMLVSRHTGRLLTWNGGNVVRSVDTETYEVTDHRNDGMFFSRIVESPTDAGLWYTVFSKGPGTSGSYLGVYRHTTAALLQTIPLPDVAPGTVTEMRVSADEKSLFFGHFGGWIGDYESAGDVISVDLASGQMKSTPIPGGAGCLELSPDSRRLYVGAGWPKPPTDLISVIDTASGAVVAKIPIGKTKYGWYQTQTNALKLDPADPSRLYAANTDGNALVTLRLDTGTVADVKVLNREDLQPHTLAAAEASPTGYVLLTKNARAVVVDRASGRAAGLVELAGIRPDAYLFDVAFEKTGRLLVAQGTGSVLELEAGGTKLVAEHALPRGTPGFSAFVLSRDGQRLYCVTNDGPGSLPDRFLSIDRATFLVEKSLKLEGGSFAHRPFELPDGRKLYVPGGQNYDKGPVKVHVIGTDDLAVRKTLTFEDPGLMGISAGPFSPFAFDPSSRTLFVGATKVVLGIDTSTDTITKVIRLDGAAKAIGLFPNDITFINATGLAFQPQQRHLYIAHLDQSFVSVYDLAADRFLPRAIPLGGIFPQQLSLSPDGGKVFAINTRSDSVSVIDTATQTVESVVDLQDTLPLPDACGLFCSAVAPSAGTAGEPAAFAVSVTPSGCPAGTPSVSWSFGDGQSSSLPSASHAYVSPGTYLWGVTATLGTASCTGSGSVAVSAKGAPAATWIVPSTARAAGLGGAFYSTDLTVANTGPADGTFTLRFLGHDADGRNGPSMTFPIGAGKTTVLADVLGSVFGLDSGYGAIQVGSSVTTLGVSAETSTPAQECVGGTFGQSVPAVGPAGLIAAGTTRSIPGVKENSRFRTNLILANATESATDVTVSLVLGDGTRAGSAIYHLEPLGMRQVTRVVRDLGWGADVSGARLVITPASGAAAAYASAIDSLTNDPRTLIPQ